MRMTEHVFVRVVGQRNMAEKRTPVFAGSEFKRNESHADADCRRLERFLRERE